MIIKNPTLKIFFTSTIFLEDIDAHRGSGTRRNSGLKTDRNFEDALKTIYVPITISDE